MSRYERKERQAKAAAQYKSLTKDIQSRRRDDDPTDEQQLISEHLAQSDELYTLVKKKLPGTAADARHMKTLMRVSANAAKKINTQARHDIKKVISSLRRIEKSNLPRFVVEHCSDCLRIAPSYEFFYGAIKSQALEIKERKKRIKIQADETVPVSAKEKNIAIDCEQDATPKEVDKIHDKIKRLSTSSNHGSGIPFISTIIDPESFTQTVENIFHTSFLVKEGRVGIKKGPRAKPVISYESASSDSTQERNKPRKQSILSFSMSDFNRWINQSS